MALADEGHLLAVDATGSRPMAPDVGTHRFTRLVTGQGLDPIRFHELRN